jgi:DMSO/TMAO reductase YedYZ molybdopterin-dependent catalytic subunit
VIARRQVIVGGIGALAGAAMASELERQPANLPAGTRASAELARIDGKLPLIKRSWRPPNFETPLRYFTDPITRNDAFFVRYHGAAIPQVGAADWRLSVGGAGAVSEASFSLDELRRRFPLVEVTAICLCSGNRRGMFEPHVPGIQWGPGAMGNARWTGVRLRDVLLAVGVRKEALEVGVDGADSALLTGPDFVKSIPVWKALEEDALIALQMNGEPLPHWNGFPARLVVPGWTATYWVKHLTRIEILTQPSAGFWMKTGYRIPSNRFPVTERFISQETGGTTPITEIVVNSLIVEPPQGTRVAHGREVEARGIAWDGGSGIARVEYSVDEGRAWFAADLGQDLGRFSFRPWMVRFTPRERGPLTLQVRAQNRQGVSQPDELIRNPAGYHHNLVQRLGLEVA